MNIAQKLTKYKAWANKKTYDKVCTLPDSELKKHRQSCFDSIILTLNHVYIVDDIFKAHLEGKSHGYNARYTQTSPSIFELWQATRNMDEWWIELASRLTDVELSEKVDFEFVDGGKGTMTRMEMILHSVNHATYHRGYVDDMLYHIPVTPPATDFSVCPI